MVTVLVTGGNGFIGSHLCRALVRRGHRVRIFDLPGTAGGAVADLDAEQAQGSILDPAALDAATTGVDVVYHLAAKVMDWGRREDFDRLNVRGTRNVLSAAIRAGARQFILMSSLAVHGWRDHAGADETDARDVPESYPYGATKRIAEDLVLDAHRSGSVAATIIRPGFFPFGPWDNTSFVPLAENLPRWFFSLVGRGDKRTCTSYVENLAGGMALACGNEAAYGETFVIADEGAPSWREVFAAIARHLGVRAPRPGLPARLLYAIAWLMDRLWLFAGARTAPPLTRYRINLNRYDFHFRSDKAKRLLGYAPAVTLDEGLARTVAWYRGASER